MIEKIKENKLFKLITMLVKTIITFFIVIVIGIIFIQRISNNKLTLGGYGMYTIITESMVPVYNVSDMVISKKVDTNKLNVGDDIVYMGKKDDFKDKIVTHRIIKKETIDNITYFHTKGIANDIEDPVIASEQILGKVVYKSYILSFISRIVNNAYGFYFVIFVPFGILSSLEIIDIINERKNNEE